MTKDTATPLWAADGLDIDAEIQRYCAADDAVLDNALLHADIRASRAHAVGLKACGILSAEEQATLDQHLAALQVEAKAGTFRCAPSDEDGHSAIERELVARAGDVGKKVHTGRSRNDQILVATRLWLRDELATLQRFCLAAAKAGLDAAEATHSVVMPGYTHLQRAVPSTVGFWYAGHAESLLEDAQALGDLHALINRSPLGTAAGYGVNLDLERDLVAKELGFDSLVINGLCAQNGRGRLDAHVLGALLMPMGTARRIAWDLSLYAMGEMAFVKLPNRWTTGSSIMPNKRNPDVIELVRGAFGEVAGAHTELLHVTALPSAYQRDLQRTKAPLMRGVSAARATLALLPRLLSEISFDADACAAALEPAMLATDKATTLAAQGVPFREAYRQIKEEGAQDVGDLKAASALSIASRTSLGSPGALALDRLRDRWETLSKTVRTDAT